MPSIPDPGFPKDSMPTSMSDVYAELSKLYEWRRPREFFTLGDVDFDEASNWTITYQIIRQSWILICIIAFHVAVVSGFVLIAYGWFAQGGASFGGIAILAATMAFLHQFFYGLSSAYSNDLNNGRWFSVETTRRAIKAAIGLLPFSLLPGVAIGGLFRKRIPLRMILDRNGEMLFIGRYIHYMMCFVLAKQSSKPLTERMLEAARLSVERRHDVFDVLEGERKRYYISIALAGIAAVTQELFLIPVIAAINIFISHVGMIWMPTVAAHYEKHGGEAEKLSGGAQTILWKAWFNVTGAAQLLAVISLVGIVGHFVINSSGEKALANEEYRRTLMILPKPSDEMIGRWETSATGVFGIDRIPEMQCSVSKSGYECMRIYNQNRACYNVENYLTKVCLYDGILNEKRLSESNGGRTLLALLNDSEISINDIEFSMLPVNLDQDDGELNLERGGIFRLREGSEPSARYGRNVMILSTGLHILKRVSGI